VSTGAIKGAEVGFSNSEVQMRHPTVMPSVRVITFSEREEESADLGVTRVRACLSSRDTRVRACLSSTCLRFMRVLRQVCPPLGRVSGLE